MAIRSASVLKTKFETNDIPTETDFSDLIDSTIGTTFNVKQFGAVGDGISDDTAAIQAAIDAAEAAYASTSLSGPVVLPTGVYKTTATLTLNVGASLLGDGSHRGCRIQFEPAAAATCIHVNPASALIQMTGTKIENIWIDSADSTYDKIGIDVEDASCIEIHNLDITFLNSAGRDDVGIYCRGRESGTYSHLRIFANVPIRLGKPTSGVQTDNHVFRDLYLASEDTTATLTRACILIDDGANPSWVHVLGRNAFAKGDHAVYHAPASNLSRTQSLRFDNIRFEQGTAPTKHAFHFDYPSAGLCEAVSITNCRVSTSNSYGIYTRNVLNVNVSNFLRADAGATAAGAMLDIDGYDSADLFAMQVAAAGGAAGEQDYAMGSGTCLSASSDLQSAKFPLHSKWVKNWAPTNGATAQPIAIRDNLGVYTRVTRINNGATELQSFLSTAGVLGGHFTITVVGQLAGSSVLESGVVAFADRSVITARGFKLVSGTENFNCVPGMGDSFNVYSSGPLTTITFENFLGEDVYVIVEARLMFDSTAARTVQNFYAPTKADGTPVT